MVSISASNGNRDNRHIIADAALRRLLQDRIWEFGQVHEILHHGLGKLAKAERSPRPISHQNDEVSVLSAKPLFQWLNRSTSQLLFARAFSEDVRLAVPNQVSPRIADSADGYNVLNKTRGDHRTLVRTQQMGVQKLRGSCPVQPACALRVQQFQLAGSFLGSPLRVPLTVEHGCQRSARKPTNEKRVFVRAARPGDAG